MGRPSVAAERREQIAWGLYECLVTANFDRVTIRDVAAAAAVKPGIIHHYFDDKEEIFATLAATLSDLYHTRLDDHLGSLAVSADRLEATIGFIVDELILDRSVNRVLYSLTQMSLDTLALRGPIRDLFELYRQRLHEEFSLASGGAPLVAMIEGLALQHTVDPRRFGRDDFVDLITEFVSPLVPPPEQEQP